MCNKMRALIYLAMTILLTSPVQAWADLVVATDTETSLELRWVELTSEPFNSTNWNIAVEVVEPPPFSADFPTWFYVTATHLATPHEEGGPGKKMNVSGHYGGRVPFPDWRFPAVGQPPFVFEQISRIHDGIGEEYHIDKTVLSGTRVFSDGMEKMTFLLESEHFSVPKTSLITDLNGDNIVDDKDMNILLSNFDADGPGGGNPSYNQLNLDALLLEFGSGAESASAIPEPTSMVLLLFGVLGLLSLHPRR